MDPIPVIRSDTNNMPKLLIVIGTSTGGPQALTTVFSSLPAIPGAACLVVQHMPKGFTTNLAKRLNHLSQWHVKEAVDGESISEGMAHIAPGGFQMRVQDSGQKYFLSVKADGPVNGHEPSVDAMFCSVANAWRGPVIGVLMTGMGKDGAIGLQAIRNQGGYTIAEAQESCVVFGMPKAAISLGAAIEVTPLAEIATAIVEKSKDLDNLGIRSVRSDA